LLKLQFCGTSGCLTPGSKSLERTIGKTFRWKKLGGSKHPNSMTIEKFDDNENYCSLKFLALEVGSFFFGIFNQN